MVWKNTKLKYDTEVLASCAKSYAGIAEDMTKAKENLNESITRLITEDWISAAGQAFQDVYSATWADSVDKYRDVLLEYSVILKSAATKYDALTDQAGTLNFPVMSDITSVIGGFASVIK